MFTCPTCYDSFLFQPDPCPTCAAQQRRRAKTRKAQERRGNYDPDRRIPAPEFWQLLKWYSGCPCCGQSWATIGETICQDHIIPISRGGIHAMSNLQPLCQSCNQWKSDHLIYFDPAIPGQAAALPIRLHAHIQGSPHYFSHSQPEPQLQLNLMIESTLAYPYASPDQLEQQTLQLTWAMITSSKHDSSPV